VYCSYYLMLMCSYVVSAIANKMHVHLVRHTAHPEIAILSHPETSVSVYVTMHVCALTLSLQSCLSNICYLVCGFDKSAHHTHTHSLFLSLGHAAHTHTHSMSKQPYRALRASVYPASQLCPDKGEREA